MERRKFIKNCGLLCASAIGAASFLESCKSVFYIPNSIENNKIVVRKTDFAQNKFVLVRNERLPAPIYLAKVSEEVYSAVLMICTHKSCELNTAGEYLVCPCHGSEFSNTGKVLNPPAEKDLESYSVTSDNTFIYIQL